MAGKLAYTLHIKIELKNGNKPKYPQIGAIVKNESTGHLYGNIELLPLQPGGWDGKFYLFIPDKRGGVEQPPEPKQNTEESPW